MKLIIDIPDEAYNVLLTEQVLPPHIDVEWLLIHGIPLDDVRAEIEQINSHSARFRTSDGTVVYVDSHNVLEVLDNILDNIGKAESEDT